MRYSDLLYVVIQIERKGDLSINYDNLDKKYSYVFVNHVSIFVLCFHHNSLILELFRTLLAGQSGLVESQERDHTYQTIFFMSSASQAIDISSLVHIFIMLVSV